MQIFVMVVICLFAVVFAAFAFCIGHGERKARREIEKELNEVKQNEENAAEIITEANKTKADARTGDHGRDIDYMARRLHNYANE